MLAEKRVYNKAVHKQEPLISVSNVSDRIKVYPYYFKQKIPGALSDCYLREGVVNRLVKAAENLPTNCHLVILDGWRSFETQSALYQKTKAYFETKYTNEKDVLQQLSSFVATPSNNPEKPAPHYSGGAVDLTVANEQGWLNMGTGFDAFVDQSFSLFFEKKERLTAEEIDFRNNRRILRNSMEKAGFRLNDEEWWHFDYGNARWANGTNKSPIYYGIDL